MFVLKSRCLDTSGVSGAPVFDQVNIQTPAQTVKGFVIQSANGGRGGLKRCLRCVSAQ